MPFKPTTTVTPKRSSASSDKTGRRDDRRGGARSSPRRRDQHRRHQRRPRDAARRPDAEPLGGARPGGVHCRADRHRHAQPGRTARPARARHSRDRNRPARRARSTGHVFLGEPSRAATDHRPAVHDLPRRRGASLDVSVRLQGSVSPNPTTGRLEVSFLDNPQLPFSELRLTLNGGEHAPLANPLGCSGTTAFNFSAYTGASIAGTTPFTASGCPGSIPVLARPEHGDSTHESRRVHQLHVQPHARRRQPVSAAPDDDAARGPGRRDPVGAAVRRTAGVPGHVPGHQPDRHGERHRRLGRRVSVQRTGVPDRPLQRRAVRPVDPGRGRRGAVRPRHARHARVDRRRPAQRARDRGRPRCRRSSRACRCACATSACSSTSRTSCSTRPTAARCRRTRR